MIRRRSATPTRLGARSATSSVLVASQAEQLDRLLRRRRGERLPVERRPFTSYRRPLLAGSEVVDVAEVNVGHRRTIRHCDRQREERYAALGVDRAVDRVEDDGDRAALRRRAIPELLGDEREVAAHRVEPLDDRHSQPLDRWPSSRLLPRRRRRRARARPASAGGESTSLTSSVAARQISSQSVTEAGTGGRRAAWGRSTSTSAASSRHDAPSRARASIGVGRTSSAASASPRSTAAIASPRSAVYVTPSGPSRSTSAASGSPGSPSTIGRPITPVDDCARTAFRQPAEAVLDAGARAGRRRARADAAIRWVGKIVSPSCAVGQMINHQPRAFLTPVLGMEGKSRLIAMVAVGDEQLCVERAPQEGRPSSRQSRLRTPSELDLDVRRKVRPCSHPS